MYKRNTARWLKHFDFILLDLLCLQMAYFVAYTVRNGFGNPYAEELYLNIGLVLALVSVLTAFFTELYSGVLRRGYYKEFISTLRQSVIVELIATFYLFFTKNGDAFSRMVLLLMGVFYLISSYMVRVFWKRILKKKTNDAAKRSLLIVTTKELMEECVRQIKQDTYNMFYFAGLVVIDEDYEGKEIDGIRVVANIDHVVAYACREWIDEVLINLPLDMPTPDEVVNAFTKMGIATHLTLAREHEFVGKKQFVEKIGNYMVLTTSISVATPSQIFLKRALDIMGGIAGCIITALLYLVLAPIIWVQSPGPVFFKQVRVGKNGKKFQMYKFRTMYIDAEERKAALMEQNRVKDGMMFKLEFDPRVIGNRVLPDGTKKTGIMELVRKMSLDEFPQFFNVLKGDMSLVGTRPPTLDEWEKYELHHHARLAAKPGITGMWQVSGRSSITDFEEVVKLDTQYISEWSMGLDLKILVKTVGVVLKREGAM